MFWSTDPRHACPKCHGHGVLEIPSFCTFLLCRDTRWYTKRISILDGHGQTVCGHHGMVVLLALLVLLLALLVLLTAAAQRKRQRQKLQLMVLRLCLGLCL